MSSKAGFVGLCQKDYAGITYNANLDQTAKGTVWSGSTHFVQIFLSHYCKQYVSVRLFFSDNSHSHLSCARDTGNVIYERHHKKRRQNLCDLLFKYVCATLGVEPQRLVQAELYVATLSLHDQHTHEAPFYLLLLISQPLIELLALCTLSTIECTMYHHCAKIWTEVRIEYTRIELGKWHTIQTSVRLQFQKWFVIILSCRSDTVWKCLASSSLFLSWYYKMSDRSSS